MACVESILNKCRGFRFLRDESGTLSVESVLWLPIYILFFALIADVSMVFHNQTKAMRIVQDANRLASRGILEDAASVRETVEARVRTISANAEVTSAFGVDTVATTVVMPARDMTMIGLVGALSTLNVTISSMHLVES